MTTAPPITDALRRHQCRRLSGVPTVTAFVGPLALTVRAWCGWAGMDRRPYACAGTADPNASLFAWVEAAFAAVSPVERACAWLAAGTGRSVEAVERDVARMTRYDLDTLRRSLPTDLHGSGATAVFLILDDRISAITTNPAHLLRGLSAGLGAADPLASIVRAVAELYPPELWPALLLTSPVDAPDEWGLLAARTLERVAGAEPRVPVAVALTADEYGRLLARHPDVRAVALLREGFVELRGVSGNQLGERLRAAGVEPETTTVERLTSGGLADDVADAYVVAARSVREPTPTDLASDFRSVHESFLFEQLESMPQTAGLFRPNHPLEFRHGSSAAEGDLVAESLKLAVEVDGGFYHLNPDQYRRDRRKDWLYQRHGYLVLRFLAEDVVRDLELVLNTILEAVALRRASTQPTGAI